MVTEESINDIFSNILNHNTKTSKLAVTSMIFGLLAPVCFAAVWIVSLLLFYFSSSLLSHDLITIGLYIMIAFSYSVAWILGLALGLKSLEKIRNSEQHLVGKAYAFVGISISAVWMVVLIARFLLPALFYVNS
jgi:cytosine/uracil/thiamine/allantoin permease